MSPEVFLAGCWLSVSCVGGETGSSGGPGDTQGEAPGLSAALGDEGSENAAMHDSHDQDGADPQAGDRLSRATAAAVTIARAHGLHVNEPAVLADAYSVLLHLPPAPVVARVATLTALLRSPMRPWLDREVRVAGFLADRGAPVVAPSDELPAGPHHHDGLGVTFWRYIRPDPDHTPDAAETARMLADLHGALREYPGELPLLCPPLNDIPRGLERLDRAGSLAVSDRTLLQDAYDRLRPLLENPPGPVQPLHGDAHPHNLIATGGRLLWHDFEDTCAGPIGWDLASVAMFGEDALAAYPDAPDPVLLEPYREARLLQGAVWVLALLPEYPPTAEFAQTLLDYWRAHG